MIWLLISVVSSVAIFVVFRLSKTWKLDVRRVILMNYAVAAAFGLLLFRPTSWPAFETIWWLLPILGVMFFGIFFLMGRSSAQNGTGVTSFAAKSSMAIPFFMGILLHHEQPGLVVYGALILGLIGAALVFLAPGIHPKNLVALVTIFLGSGLLDSLLDWSRHELLAEGQSAAFSVICFASALTLALITLTVTGTIKGLSGKEMAAGVLLGIPNFFSIYALIQALDEIGHATVVFPLLNMAIILSTVAVGRFMFKERLTARQWVGLGVSFTALLLLATGNN